MAQNFTKQHISPLQQPYRTNTLAHTRTPQNQYIMRLHKPQHNQYINLHQNPIEPIHQSPTRRPPAQNIQYISLPYTNPRTNTLALTQTLTGPHKTPNTLTSLTLTSHPIHQSPYTNPRASQNTQYISLPYTNLPSNTLAPYTNPEAHETPITLIHPFNNHSQPH